MGERSATLFVERWVEQLRTTFVPRRARTLAAYSAIDELLSLAEGFVRSGGSTRPSIDPEDGGHGVKMLADVAQEAADLVAECELLRSNHVKRKEVLQDLVRSMASKENVTSDSIAILRALAGPLKKSAVPDAFVRVLSLVRADSKERTALCELANTLVSELRSQGWSDEALLDAGIAARDMLPTSPPEAIEKLRELTLAPIRQFRCYVTVAMLPPLRERLSRMSSDETFTLVETLPPLKRVGRPLKSGSLLQVVVPAYDFYAAAAVAHRRVLSTLGALAVFLPGSRVEVTGDLVAVEESNELRVVELQEKLVEEKRRADEREQLRIIESAWKASGSATSDPLHDALRLRHRAFLARDSESRLLLLWSSIERMTAGARGYDGALSAAKALVSHAVSFGKLRRDIGDLIGAIQHAVAQEPKRRDNLFKLVGVDYETQSHDIAREKVLALLLGEKHSLRTLTEIVYDTSPLLAFRCHEMWKALGSGNSENAGKCIATYFEASRVRISRQVGRIYRARNRIAHVGTGAERVRDLVWHAHFYLTQLTAICVHYTEARPRPAQEVLLARMGQYQAFIRLLKAGDESAMRPDALLRPSLVVGGEHG